MTRQTKAASSLGTIRAIQSPAAAIRLREARAFVDQFAPGDEVLLLGASRGAVDDFARAIALEKGATFGLHRLSFTQLAARLAALHLASSDRAPATSLGHEAVATRATFEAHRDDALEYFAPVARTPGFPKALARTLLELRLAGASGDRLVGLSRSGPDLAELLDRVDLLMREAGASDRAALFETATQSLSPQPLALSPDPLALRPQPSALSPDPSALSPQPLALSPSAWPAMPTLLLDVPFDSEAEAQFLWALIQQSPKVLVTIPSGDSRTVARLGERGVAAESVYDVQQTDLGHLTRYLFSPEPPPERSRSGELVWFSAPGEGRECVEIARRLLKEAARGVRFDEMAILVRSPQQYLGVLEHALSRAKIPAYFDRGTRRPHPAGRAFLALLSCAVEKFSAKRFAEYLSLAQVPDLDSEGEPRIDSETTTWVASSDEVFGVTSDEAAKPPTKPGKKNARSTSANAMLPFDEPAPKDQRPTTNDHAVSGTLRAPWKWESLLVESAVIGGATRWSRRLKGLDREYELKIRALRSEEPDSPRIARLERERRNLAHLRAFALPLIESMAAWPESSSWGDWLQRLEGLVPRVLRTPEDVLGVLADLRPMGAVGPVGLTEVRDVLADRLMSLEVDPPANRYGRVFIGSPHQARGRAFRVVFVPGLAERLFPQKLREDPLLLDDLRRDLAGAGLKPCATDVLPPNRPVAQGFSPTPAPALSVQEDRADLERLLLRLAVGAATDRLYVSFPRIETAEARQRVPSFYALEVMRAVTGKIPDHQALETEAAEEAKANLAWPAPVIADDAIDDFEHDLSVLRVLMRSTDDVKGHAHYMLRLNECLRRSATERWARSKSQWSQFDGIVRVTEGTRAFLQTQRLGERPYSVSALQNYAYCPYRFLLSAIYKLEPLEEPEPLQRLDPLTKGSLFHEVQAEFFRALQRDRKPIDTTPIEAVLAVLDATLTRIAAKYAEEVAPAVERVWQDEIAGMRTDLHVWTRNLADGKDWEPWLFEYAFGLPAEAISAEGAQAGAHAARDPNSVPDPVKIDGRFLLRGSIDLVERRRPGPFGTSYANILRVTDHKTSRNRSERRSIIGGGQQLQPVIYSLAVEAATGCTVETARFSYCTSAGGFTEHTVSINDMSRRVGVVAMEIIDRAIDLGMMPPAPAERACRYCDFLTVCGPEQERRAMRKSKQQIADLLALRGEP